MGGDSQNSEEEETHCTPSKRFLEDSSQFSSNFEKLYKSFTDESHIPFGSRMDGRPAKVQRTETHDLDRRPSPQQRKASHTNSSFDDPITYDSRLLRDNKDARDMVSGSREVKEEIRVLHTDMSCSHTVANATRLDVRGNERDFRFDKASDSDFKGNMKSEKDWMELIENNPAQRYSKSPNDCSYSWRPARQGTHCVDIDGNVHFLADVESFKGQVVTGDVDLYPKSEDNLKEKGRERKDWRCKDWREKGKHYNDNESNIQGASNGKKKLVEEREVDRRPRMTGYIQKDNEKKEKNSAKEEVADMAKMECLPYGKHIDGPEKVDEQETLALELRKQKDDFIKGCDDDFRGNKQEQNLQFDGEMHGICDSHDNEVEDGSNGYRAAEKGSESLGHGFQQCKRIKYARGSPNNKRKLHFSSETSDHEGIQGKTKVASIVYKPGESISKLLNLWKDFEASSGNKTGDITPYGPVLDIRIPAKHISSTNRRLRYAQMWGTDVYTIDSDIVAVLIHTGYWCPLSSPLPATIDEFRATIRVLPPQDCESILFIMNSSSQQRFVREVSFLYNLCNEPWIKYSVSIVADKGMRKPLYTSARLKKGEVLYLETHFNRYELCFNGEKACLNSEKQQCHNSLVQACDRNATDGENIVDIFRWARCKKPLPESMLRSIGIPLPTEHLVVLEENLDWEDIQWSQASVWVSGKEYQLARVHFLSPK